MLRKIVVILTMLLCSMATQLYALGLGTVTVESALNQPLRMRVELLQLGDTRLQDIGVSMASSADFERFNIDRDGFLSNIRFSVESTAQGNVVILTSSQIVREPFLSFILDTRWPNGRLLSEHTILLDLPVFDDQQSTSEIRQPISPILQPPAGVQATDAQPFIESSAAPSVTAPSSTSSAASLQPEDLSAQPVAEEVESTQAEPEEPAAQPEIAVVPAEAVEEEPAVVEEEAVVVEEEPVVVEEEAVVVEEEPVVVEEEAVVVEEEPAVVEEELVEEVAEVEPEVIEAAEEPVEPEIVEPETIQTYGSDTLSDIALQVRPNTVVSMQQTMLALQELNPEAFANGNINGLRSGQVLRVPTLEEIQSIDPRDALDEVARQNQEFAEVDVQPLAAPSNATPDQDDQPQGQLSVVSSDEAIDANSGAAGLADAENETLDQRIAELETQLAQRSEEADRARIEREELDSRMADIEAQIAAAQEIIRLQDMQLAQLQESLTAAAADAQLIAEQQAIQTAAAAEAALPVDSPSSLVDDVMRILTGNSIFILFGIVLVILLLVVLMLRRNRAAKTGAHDIDEIAEQDFDADAAEASTRDSEKDEAATEFQDYDPSDLDSELDDIIGVSGKGEGEGSEEEGATEEAPQLNVISIVEKLIGEQQYRRALSMLNTSLQEQGDNEEVRAKISEVEHLLEAEEIKQREIDEATRAKDAANRESETKSFLDDLGIDLDSFDYDDEANEPEVEKAKDEPASVAATEEVSDESDDVDMMFDLGGDDDAGESNVEEFETEETETFEFNLDDDSNAVKSEAKDSEDLDIDTLEFDVDPIEKVTADEDEEIDLETFAFNVDAAPSVTETVEEKEENAAPEADPNAIEFSFDAREIDNSAAAPQPASNEEVETFDFDLDDDDAGDTVLEKPDTEVTSATEDDVEEFDFDLDEFEIEQGTEETTLSDADADDDFLGLDAEEEQVEAAKAVIDDDEIEFDIEIDDEPDETIATTDDDLTSDDDLEFLSDDDVEIESIDDIEEVDMLSADDEAATKLELAYAYQKMGDVEGATEILQEVIKEGSDEQVEEARKLLGTLDGKSD
jgi:pilus assembly protein FimV